MYWTIVGFSDFNHLLAQVLEFVWHTSPISQFDVLCQSLTYSALILDVVRYALSSEWDRCVMPHYFALVYSYRCSSCAEINQGYPIFNLFLGQTSLGHY